MRRRDPGATLSPTTLLNEAWLKLVRTPAVAQSSPLHFKRIAARAMRQVLISAARRRSAGKRNAGPAMLVTFDEELNSAVACDEALLALDSALEELARMNPRHALMVENRFFGGLEVHEIAELLGVSEATVLRDWRGGWALKWRRAAMDPDRWEHAQALFHEIPDLPPAEQFAVLRQR